MSAVDRVSAASRALIALAGLAFAGPTFAQAPLFGGLAAVDQCLRANDVPCAKKEIERMGAARSQAPDVLAAAARVAFYDGDYPAARVAMDAAVEAGFDDRWQNRELFERTLYATSGWAEQVALDENGAPTRFRVRFLPGLDEVLLTDAAEALVQTEAHLTPLLGEVPPGETILEVFPDKRSFIASSSLTEADVRTTGVVALSKWSRLLVTSPRVLARGYDWQDTVAHEYVHLVVAHNTDDRAPVWLQEAIAKYLDNRWRDGKDHWKLSVRDRGLVAQALEDDDLVTFDEMHPSLAKLPTAERAALAYAQVSALMAFCFERQGQDVLLRTLPLVKDGMDAREALARGAGFDDFASLEKAYLVWLRGLDLKGHVIEELPTVFAEDALDAGASDPVLARRGDLQRYVRLGAMLREHERPKAALVEYEKARDPDEPTSPYLANMIAQTHLSLGDLDAAEKELSATLLDYPEFALTHKTLGAIALKRGRVAPARVAYQAAVALNPYDSEVQSALLEIARASGDLSEAAAREARLRILRQGGSDVEWTPIHTESGEYTLPGGAETSDAKGLSEAFVGELAPQIRVADLAGASVTLKDFEGQVVVLDFWATWCGPCRSAMPHLMELDARDGVAVLGLTDESASKVKAFIAKTPLSYRIGLDEGGATKKRYGVASLPTVFVIGPSGRVEAVVVGAGPAATAALDAAVNDAIAL